MASVDTIEQRGSERGLDRTTALALVAMGVAVFIIANDFTALAVALPAIEVFRLDTALAVCALLVAVLLSVARCAAAAKPRPRPRPERSSV